MKIFSIIFSLFLIINLVKSIEEPKIVSIRRPTESVYPGQYCSPVFTLLINYTNPIEYNYQLSVNDKNGGYGSAPLAMNGTLYLFTVTHRVPIGKNQSVSFYLMDTSIPGWATYNFDNYTTYDCDPLPSVTIRSLQNSWVRVGGQYSSIVWYHMAEVKGLSKSVPYDTFTCTVPSPFVCYFQEFLNGPIPTNFLFQVAVLKSDINFSPFNVIVTDKQGKVLLNSTFDGLSSPVNPPVSITSLQNYPANGSTVTKGEMINEVMYMMNILNKNALCGISSSEDYLVGNTLIPVLGSPANATYIGFSSFSTRSPLQSYVQIIDSQGTKRVGMNNTFAVNQIQYDNFIQNVTNADYQLNSNINKTLVNVKGDVSYNPNTYSSVSFLRSNFQNNLVYPFGYSNGTVKYHSVSVTQVSPIYTNNPREYITLISPSDVSSGGYQYIPVYTNATKDNILPQLLKVETVFLTFEKVLLRIFAKDVESGLSMLYSTNMNKITSADLVYGDNFNGVYEVVESLPVLYGVDSPTVSLYDNAGNNAQFTSSQPVFDTSFNMLPQYPVYKYIKSQTGLNPFNFTGFEFKFNDVDVSNGPFNNTLCFNFVGSNKTMIPYFLQFPLALNPEKASLDLKTPGVWDENKGMFCVDFQIPARVFGGDYSYAVIIPPFVYDSNYLAASIGKQSALRVVSSFADQMPPIITEFSSYPSNNVSISQDFSIGWNIRIEDSPNGFASAEFNITSEFDLEPYRIKITPANATSGNLNSGTYQLRIPISATTCRSQSFRISAATITDTVGHTSVLPSKGNINPLHRFLGSQHLVINITCPQAIVDITPPVLTSFTPSVSSIDVGTYKDFRNVTFTFKTTDSGSGISKRHNPIVYLSSGEFEQISKVGTLVSYVNGVATYTCTVQLPYGYGTYNGIILSIYGIVDNQLNINGYSSVDLQTLGFQNTIKVLYSDVPVLDSTSSIKSTGSSLTIYGHKFGIDKSKLTLQVDYMNGQGWKNTSVSFFSGIILMTDSIIPTSTPFYVRVIVDGKISNSLLVVPIVVEGPCSYEIIQSVVATWIDSEKYPYLQSSITIKNTGTRPIKLFSFIIENIAYNQIWGVDSNGNNRYTLPSYNPIINPRDQYSFGYIVQGTTVADLKQVTYTCL
ncbi:hypothetical protein RB653_006757 [Dictyostelium firmibasis]|uniref:Carbohydrate binding domain-containing protein n=1 Tax=Dictyostelium firmibasis TaxID=79012 RepID=A0AAN7TMA7_9MYCE